MRAFKTVGLSVVCVAASAAAMAQDVGRVISTQPVLQQIAVPRQVCNTEQVAVQGQKSGAGAVMGALAGGAVGNSVGRGAGNAAATMIGIMGGAILGDRIEGEPPTQLQTVQNCRNQNFYENKTVGYNVVYEFGGKQYAVQTPYDPGPTIQVQVAPVGMQAAPSQQPSYQQPSYQQPTYQQPVVIESRTAYPVYVQPVYVQPAYAPRYYPPISLNFGWEHGGGGYRHGPGHWR